MRYTAGMGIIQKLGGLVGLVTLSSFALGITPSPRSADACGWRMPMISFNAGDGGVLPKGSKGISFQLYSQTQLPAAKNFQVTRVDGKQKSHKVTFQIQAGDKPGSFYLAFDQPASPGERYTIAYDGTGPHTFQISNAALQAASNLSLQIEVDSRGGATIHTSTNSSEFSDMWNYTVRYQGSLSSVSSSASSFLNLCASNNPEQLAGWQELAVEITPGNEEDKASIITRDVWVDCQLAQKASHPSISKASHEFFVPTIARN